MLTDTELRSKVDTIWDRLWSSGCRTRWIRSSNSPICCSSSGWMIARKSARSWQVFVIRRYKPQIEPELRWSHWINFKADDALKHIREKVFPSLREMGVEGSSFERYMQNAEFKVSKPSTLIEVCNLIDQMKISEQNQDVQGDLYEYLLSKLSVAGRNGQFRTPRHIIRMMVSMVDPKPNERIGDLAAGTCGFPVNAYQHILAHHPLDTLEQEQRDFLQQHAFTAYDNDSGMTMLRIGSMNLMLHGIQHPRFFYTDTLSKGFNDEKSLDVVLMNPPFKGKMDESDINPLLPTKVKKTELLFLHLILRVLDMGGRCAVIVPDGVLFGSSRAHTDLRKRLIEENRLDGVVSMPSGVFKPYAGVSTAVLLFTRGGTTDRIWFYDMEHDGFSLDDKRQLTPDQNDIPDLLLCWQHRFDTDFTANRATRLADLKRQIAPMKTARLLLQKEINRLMFEAAIAPDEDEERQQALDTDQQKLTTLHEQMAPLQWEINQLNRQFWVTKDQVCANKYDLSASRYRQMEQDEVYYESPQVTMERLLKLEHGMAAEVAELEKLLEG